MKEDIFNTLDKINVNADPVQTITRLRHICLQAIKEMRGGKSSEEQAKISLPAFAEIALELGVVDAKP